MSGENNKIKQSEVIESIDTIKQYIKEGTDTGIRLM